MAIPFTTMQERHLVYAYALMWLLQGGYAGWVAWQWFHTRRPVRKIDS